MKTLAIIPARLGASRLPRKPLRLLAGLPLVVRVWQRVQSLHVADQCVIATDSEEVARVVRAAGADCALTAEHHPSGTDRVFETITRPEYAGHRVVVNEQGDEPFVPPAAVRGAIELVESGRFPLATVAATARPEVLHAPSVVKVVCADDGRAMYFSRAAIPFLRDAADTSLRDGIARRHLGVYAYTPEALAKWVALPPHPLERVERLEQLRPLAAGIAMGVAVIDEPPGAEWEISGIDTEDDLIRANERWPDLIAGRF